MLARRSALAGGLILFAVWSLATWYLEGRIETLLRPEAVVDRLLYAVVGNLLLGVVVSAAYVAYSVRAGTLDADRAGFASWRRTAWWCGVGLVLGLGGYLLQGAPSLNPIVIINAFSQVLVVSAAEVLVCWCVVGAAVEANLGEGRGRVAMFVSVLAAAVLFGAYHFAHSAPFNTWRMVGLLCLVGLVTGAFFMASRSAIATTIFHNFLGTFGVLQALAKADALAPLERLQPPLLGTAMVTLFAMLMFQAVIRKRRSAGWRPSSM